MELNMNIIRIKQLAGMSLTASEKILLEAEPAKKMDDYASTKPTSKTTTKPKVNLGNMFNDKTDNPLANATSDNKLGKGNPDTTRAMNTASRNKTLQATKGIDLPTSAIDHLSNLHTSMPGDIDNEPDTASTEIVKHDATNVPAMISNSMVTAGFSNPDFHLVSNLPGNMASSIRQLGKVLFGALTSTPTDQISMIGNMQGNGPNSKDEINAVSQYLKQFGTDLGPGEIDFNKIMPGYKADIHNFAADGNHFMLVKDPYGQYIYAWPEHTSTENAIKGTKVKRLESSLAESNQPSIRRFHSLFGAITR